MPIDPTKTSPSTRLTSLRPERNQPVPAAGKKADSAPTASAQFHPSKLNDSSGDIDSVRVAEIRNAISKGELKVDTHRIADAIIDSARELSNSSQD